MHPVAIATFSLMLGILVGFPIGRSDVFREPRIKASECRALLANTPPPKCPACPKSREGELATALRGCQKRGNDLEKKLREAL